MDQRFPKSLRLRSPAEFGIVIRTGAHAVDDVLVCNALPNALSFSRIGISIPKKTGNAVNRNRWKRLIREAFRTQKDQIPEGFDFVIRPRRGATAAHLPIRNALVGVMRRAARKQASCTAKPPQRNAKR